MLSSLSVSFIKYFLNLIFQVEIDDFGTRSILKIENYSHFEETISTLEIHFIRKHKNEVILDYLMKFSYTDSILFKLMQCSFLLIMIKWLA